MESRRDCNMDMERKINAALSYAGINKAELARRMGTTPQALGSKIKRGMMPVDEVERMAEKMGCKWVAYFEFDDGLKI